MIIRRAKKEEYNGIATHILLAMEDIIYRFIGEDSKEKALLFLSSLIKEENTQYSYKNCWVVESQQQLVAAAIVYNGSDLHTLRAPVEQLIKSMFDRSFNTEDETASGEYYIDSIGVDPSQQGKGIGSKILQFLIQEYVDRQNKTLGLLVDKDNPNAKKLYLKLGFEHVGEKEFSGKQMEHLQIKRHH